MGPQRRHVICLFYTVVLGAQLNVMKTSPVMGRKKVYNVHFHDKSTRPRDIRKWFSKVLDGTYNRVYCVVEFDHLSEESMTDITNLSPPPESISPFLLPHRVTVFVTILPPDECFLVPPHIDEHGSGPLVYGPSVTGAYTSFAVCAPDYSTTKEVTPPELLTIYSSNPHTTTRPIHVFNINTCGSTVNLPAGCWHAVRTYGSSIRVSYYFQQREE